MLKQISNLGTVLNKAELQGINGGATVTCTFADGDSWWGSAPALENAIDMFTYCDEQGGIANLYF